jgi:pimeloyl-ACP methyl ester carboxylesterase
MTATDRGGRVSVRDCTVYVRRAGSGETVLFLHGLHGLGDHPTLVERLAARCDVIAPDHPGYGASDNPAWLDDVRDLAFFYADFLDTLDLKDVHLVGHSLGGWIALELAARSRSRLKSLTLVSAAGIRVEGVPRADVFMPSIEEVAALLFVDQNLARDFVQAETDLDRFATVFKNRTTAAKLTWQPRLFDLQLMKWLHRITLPTLVLWGEADRVLPLEHAEALKRCISGAELSTLANCGHASDVERPHELATAIIEFIERLSA